MVRSRLSLAVELKEAFLLPPEEERALPLLAAEASSFCWARAASCSCLARLA